MKLTREEVLHVAALARLALTEEEIAKFSAQLSQILAYMETLRELDLRAVPPTAQVIPLQNVMRPDEPQPSFPLEEILANAPRRADDFFRVQAILEEQAEAVEP